MRISKFWSLWAKFVIFEPSHSETFFRNWNFFPKLKHRNSEIIGGGSQIDGNPGQNFQHQDCVNKKRWNLSALKSIFRKNRCEPQNYHIVPKCWYHKMPQDNKTMDRDISIQKILRNESRICQEDRFHFIRAWIFYGRISNWLQSFATLEETFGLVITWHLWTGMKSGISLMMLNLLKLPSKMLFSNNKPIFENLNLNWKIMCNFWSRNRSPEISNF